MRHLLWDWLGSLVAWVIVLAGVGSVYGLGRWHGRLAERRDVERFRAEVAELFDAPTVPIPAQREAL